MLLLAGVFGIVLAGAIALAPLTDGADQVADTDDQADAGQDADAPSGDASAEPDIISQSFAEQIDLEIPQEDQPAETPAGAASEPLLADQVYGQHMGDALQGNLFQQLAFNGHANTGGVGDDEIAGGTESDWLVGNEGDDTLNGAEDDDLLTAEAGDDVLDGGSGSDVLDAGDGADTLTGGTGDDLLMGGEGDDSLVGGAGDDHLFGQLGADTLDGGDGDDFIDGTHAATTSPAWTDEDDADLIFGGDGDDILVLGAGDLAAGGAGEDIFAIGQYEGTQVVPLITDFDPAEDEVQILYQPGDAPVGEITTSVDGDTLTVLLDGAQVVQIAGVTEIDSALIRLVPIAPAASGN